MKQGTADTKSRLNMLEEEFFPRFREVLHQLGVAVGSFEEIKDFARHPQKFYSLLNGMLVPDDLVALSDLSKEYRQRRRAILHRKLR